MEKFPISFKCFGEQAIIIEWPAQISPRLLKIRIAYERLISENFSSQFQNKIIDIVPAYHSITLIFQNVIQNSSDKINFLNRLYAELKQLPSSINRIVQIPVCYENNFASDIKHLAKAKKLSIQELIDLHTKPLYEVYFLGFLPGFMYLGGLDERLHQPRKARPDLSVPRGAVAIGGQQTGVYPQESPGGWHVIGSTPVELFNPYIENSSVAVMGDKIKFTAVTLKEYSQIQNAVSDGSYQFSIESCND